VLLKGQAMKLTDEEIARIGYDLARGREMYYKAIVLRIARIAALVLLVTVAFDLVVGALHAVAATDLTPAQQQHKTALCTLHNEWPDAPTGVPWAALSADCPAVNV
jgi:hypothetical protein